MISLKEIGYLDQKINMLRLNISLIILLFFVTSCFSQDKHPNLKGKKVLVVYGGWEGHQPEVFAKKIASWLKDQQAEVRLEKGTAVYTDTSVMNEMDLVIQHITMSEMTNEESQGLIKAIASGVGLAGCHGGLGDSFRNDTEYQYMVGGQFVKHPGGQVTYTVEIDPKKDSITKGIDNFTLHTEQYYMHVDPALEVLATTKFSGAHDFWIEGAVVPVVWKKPFGKGRVFYNSIGHSKENFEIPEVWSLITRGIAWAAQKE
jgi:type 1 glutamine amidotransferase